MNVMIRLRSLSPLRATRSIGVAPVLLSGILLASPAEFESEGPRWLETGPSGIVLTDPVVSETLYVLGNPSILSPPPARLFQSLDAGATWKLMAEAVPPGPINLEVVVSPEARNALYATAAGALDGIFKSRDGGETWTNLQTDLDDLFNIRTLTLAPTDPPTLYIAGGPICFTDCSKSGIYKSTDLGRHWKFAGGAGRFISTLAVAPSNPNWIYGKNDSEVFRSSDGGSHWTIMPSPNSSHGCPECPMAVDPMTPTTLYLGHFQGLFKSTTGGADWTLLTAGFPPQSGAPDDYSIRDIAIDPSTPEMLYVGLRTQGVFRSTDGGSTWIELSSGLPDVRVDNLGLDATGKRIYAGTQSGLFVLDFSQRMIVEPVERPSTPPRVVPPRGN